MTKTPSIYVAHMTRSWFINDRPPQVKNGQDILERYMTDAKTLFIAELEQVISSKKLLTISDEKRLLVMLQLILDAKITWQEEEGSIKTFYKE